ncbi:uncharacterized protein DSM5745_10382 [Aspergillus mulundensis]|uniref:Kelch repeat protein n=1 Tax=Aspergillus mulundensis TaxID=1810919 RepID=A0A3D8QJ62_9EURO|nr:hypothetical protein DSM5745_10382 [Aspergillus mulundensis]RDW61710.1 hypothetical protein DSM5745_10382 [Aspergillus mulundensis]
MLRDLGLAALAFAATVGRSQAQGDVLNQINSSICTWGQLRAAVIRDTVYLDGGGFSNGQVQVNSDDNAKGLVYRLPLSSSFNTSSDNLTALFSTFEKGGGIAGNLAPTYHDGVMFANDGIGLLENTDATDSPPANTVLAYERYQYGAQRSEWEPRFVSSNLDDGVTRYITAGAGVSAPSENMGFYVSGMRAPGWGPIWDNETATNVSQRMITIDMSDMENGVFANVSLPNEVPGRANGEAVWLPVAASGVVVLIGGVTEPENIYSAGLTDQQVAESERESPAFMRTVSVYDVAGDRWFHQNTTGDIPPQLTAFCSVYASANDGSSHNIYIYGGYDGLSPLNQSSDDVFVLSVPAFEWVKLYSGNGTANGRKEHKCVRPYPDKMLVLGGVQVGGSSPCIDMIRVFNLNTGRFQDKYDPEDWDQYAVPELVIGRIGGDASGSATKTSPDAWTTTSLADVFKARYTKPIATYYPYEKTGNTSTTTVPSGGGSDFPGWAGAIIGVVLGLALLAALFAFWFLRRRKRKGSRRASETSRGSRVMNWVNAGGAFAPPGPKDPDMSTVSGGLTTANESTVAGSEGTAAVSRTTAEAGGDQVYEMHGHSAAHAVELPTSFNEATGSISASSPAMSSPAMSTPLGYNSPVSPEVPGQGPQEKEGDTPVRPTHTRNVSSLSSVQSYSPVIEEGRAVRPQYVSGVSEASISSAGTRLDSALGYRGLGLEDIPDTEGHTEGHAELEGHTVTELEGESPSGTLDPTATLTSNNNS